MLTNLKIGTKLLLRIGVLVVGLLGFMGYAYWNRTTVQVGGPLYSEVVESKDLLADILPPPAFLLEPYLVTAQMLTASPDQLPDLVARGKQLQAEYQARHDYWDKQLEPNAMRDALVVGSYQPALEFFEIRDRDFIPAVLAGDKDKATAIYAGGLRTKFEEHRARIDDTVKLAQAQGQKNEEGAALDIRHSNYVFFAAFAGLLLISVMLGANISGGITKPLAETVAVLEGVADGDLTRHLEKRSSDEMGTLAEAANRAIASMRSAISSIADNAQALAGAAEELAAVSGQMSSNAEDTSGQASIVSAASEQVSRNVETVSTGADEMTASIKEIAKNATEAARVATTAVAAAESTSATMERLGNSSDEIGKVVRVITSIAEQTNLLALNATIEAARAGESGKGFAVVANEVKELAKETAKATEDICQKVAAIQSDTGNAVGAIAEIGSIIGRINDISNSIAGAVEEQSATTNEIGRNVSEAAKGTAEIANNITGVARAAASTNSGANDARQAADELARMATELQSLVGRFKYSADAPRRVGATHEPSSTSWLGDPTSDALAASAA